MKKLLLITAFMLAINAFAQNPICVTMHDTPCDANWTQNSVWNTTGNEITGLWVHWDAGGESNSVTWEIYLDTALMYTDTRCGCGNLDYSGFFTDAAHEIIVKSKVKACVNNCSSNSTSIDFRVYSPASGNTCKKTCE